MIFKKSKPVLITFLITTTFLTAILESSSAKINEDFQVSSNSEVVENCEIAIGPNGIAYIAYAPSGSYYIKIKKTTYGDIFEDVGTITTAGATCIPKIAVDSDNNLYVVYNDNGYLNVRKLVGNTFIPMITPFAITTTMPTIATIDNGGHKVIVIPYRISGSNAIHTLVSVDDGSFSPYIFVSNLNTGATYFPITLSFDGDVFYCALGHAYGFSPYYANVTVNKFYFANSEWKWDDIVYNHTLSTGSGASRYIDVAYGKDGKLFAIHNFGGNINIREVTNYGYGENLAWLGPISIVDSDGYNYCSSVYSQFSIISSGDAICVVWRDLRYWYYYGAYYTPSVVYDCSFDNSIYGFGKDIVVNRNFDYMKVVTEASAAIYNNHIYTVWTMSSKVKMNILPLLPKASQYNQVNISEMSDLSGRPIKLPDFNVTDMAFSDPFLVMIGKNNVLAINTSNNTVLLNVTDTESTFNSVIINDSFAIIVGNKTSSAIWTSNLSKPAPTLTQVSATGDNTWIEDYGTFSDINYAYGEDCFIVSAMTGLYSYVCVVKYSENPLEWKASLSTQLNGKITSLSNVGKNEDTNYMILTWDGSKNYYYVCDGELNGEGYPNLPLGGATEIPVITTKINASVGAPIKINSKYWVYLASGNYTYRMNLDSDLQNPNVKSIDIDGDANSTYFNYTALDYVYDETGLDKVVIVGEVLLGVHQSTQQRYIRGVWAIISNVEDSNEANIVTEVFKVTNHTKPFMAVAVKDNGTIYLGGSYQIISSDYYGYETLNLDVDNVLPIAKEFRVDYASVPYASARRHAQLEPTGSNAISIWIDVLDGNGREDIKEVTLQAWHDGEDGSIAWPNSPSDANAVVNITYNVAMNQFTLNYPTTGEVYLGLGSASIVDDCTIRIKFVFVPGKQARYGNDGSATLGDDDCNWNVRFECNDSVGNNHTVHGDWEFGYVKITSLGGIVSSNVNGEIAPENNGTSSDFVINWSSNWKYRVGVMMSSNLYHAGPPEDTITPNYVSVKEAHGYTPSYVPNDFGICPNDYQSFSSLNSYVYWYSGAGGTYTSNAPTTGNEQTFMTHFNVYVPLGSASGSYSALLTYVVDIE